MAAPNTSTSTPQKNKDRFTIRPAIASDISYLPAIEQSASEIFQSVPGLGFIAADAPLSIDALSAYLSSSLLWVATSTTEETSASEIPVGFLAAERISPVRHDRHNVNNNSSQHLYIAECSVHSSYQRQGIARRLLDTAAEYASDQGIGFLTLITFLDVPWNGKFYQRRGFEEVVAEDIGDEYVDMLKNELGLWKDWDPQRWRRGVMARKL